MNSSFRTIPLKSILKITAAALGGVLLLLLVSLAFLPAVVNSSFSQEVIRKALSAAMKRHVSWSAFNMTWADGLSISHLKLGVGSAPLLSSGIDTLVIAPSVGRGTDGRFGVDLIIKIHNARAELAPGPQKSPPPPTKDPLTMLAESIQRIQGLDFPLPVDIRVLIEAAPLQITYRTPAPGKALLLQDFSIRVSMPSLASKPVTAVLSGRVLMDGHEMGTIGLQARMSDLVTKAQRIHLASANFAVDATAPGTSLSLSGGLSQPDGFSARWKLALTEVTAVAYPLLPSATPKVGGTVELLLRAKTDTNRDLHSTVTVTGAGLTAGGGSLKTGRIGPLDIKLQQNIATDHVRQRVNFSNGILAVPGLIDAAWNAAVDRPTLSDRTLELQLGPVRLDLARTVLLATPFLPPDTPVKNLTGEASLRSLHLKLVGPANSGTAAVAGFAVNLPHFRMAQKKGEFSAENVQLLLEKLECPLAAKQPVSLSADLLWSVKRALLTGTNPFLLRDARGMLGVAVTDLNMKSVSPRKVAASIQLTQSIDLGFASTENGFVMENAHEQLLLHARANDRGDIEASLPEFMVKAASLQATQAGKKLAPLPLSVTLTADGLRIPADTAVKPTLLNAAAHVSAGDVLQLAAQASLSGSSPQRAISSGRVTLDLQRAAAFAAPFVPPGMKASGSASAFWDLAAPLPEKSPAAELHPLRSAKARLSQLDKLEIGLKLEGVSVAIPSSKGGIRVTGMRTKPDLHIVTTKRGESVRLEGGAVISEISGLPGAAGKLPSQHGSFSFNGELSGWRELHLGEEVRIEPLALSHEAELNVSRIDALFEEKQPFSAATLLKRLDANLFATIDAAFPRELKQLLPGLFVAGDMSSSARVDLTAGRELALRYALKSKSFDVQVANGTKVEGLRSDFSIQRAYALTASQGEMWMPLSAALVRPVAVTHVNSGAAEIVGRIHDDLRGDVRGTRSFSIRRLTTQASGVPLVISAIEGDLLFGQEKTGVSFFQADLLGGTILARAVFDLQPDIPGIVAASSFSNLDVTRLLPKDARARGVNEDAEITGELSVSAPLTAEQRELFEQLRCALNIRKIGANTIERALFSLDPYERNEQLVAQRKMLKMGSLKGLRATAVDGAFSMEGEARIKGVSVELPKVDRLRISELPLQQVVAKNRGTIMALRGILDLVRADTLVIGTKGELTLKRRNYAQ
ncbi:MAG: hypothetical protein PHI31_03215 [Desulfuromonadaceae bacterium]|nr:hypothetical protein [Desulfuromonadaceae bacterium]